ncbi:MAG: D-alanyl-D-alanine carboxypeptidase [Sporomusaceae bacterium]|jgi:D-alanyl-D-alanine carboxypeptidase (penicillin-binding protein 5/6)|nr:D-alanyl-D-alanine carboxypeptidase [Sporomusaceae bacterium]
MRFLKMASCFLTAFFCLSPPHLAAAAAVPNISARSAILMDAKTGQVLYEKNSTQKLPPASTTKILTAIIALESGRLDEMVKVSKKAAATRGSTLHLQSEQKFKMAELVEGLLLRSGNDAAEAIAEHLSGSTQNFALLMNQKAAALGAKDSHFENPHGLSTPLHRTTTLDLANITRYALNNQAFAKIVSAKETEIEWLDSKGTAREGVIRNTNRLLWMMEDADGVKTGTTKEAGPCLVSSATRGSHRMIAVVLNDKSRWDDSMNLLKYGLEGFTYVERAQRGDVAAVIPLAGGAKEMVNAIVSEHAAWTIATETAPNLETQIKTEAQINAPLYEGQKIGELIFYLKDTGEIVKVIDLTAGENIEESNFRTLFFRNVLTLSRKLSGWGIL